jgi:hypothetical protein
VVWSLACNAAVAGAIVDTLTGVDATALAAAAAAAQRGTVVCPGLAVPAAVGTLTFPDALDAIASPTVTLGCVRDCLYLVMLDAATGEPVVARRGALQGGSPPAVVVLPQAKLKPGTYRLDVRLVNRVNPGPVTQQLSPPLAVG